MNPAFSVILLTTLIGIGQGLFLALWTGQVYSLVEVLPAPDSHRFYVIGSAISLAFLVAGLLASFFHLGHPERAWRSAAMWRTSWLSREVIVLPMFMGVVFCYGMAHYFGWNTPQIPLRGHVILEPSLMIGTVGVALCFALFICTAMIYACIKFLQEWHSSLTVINYFLLGCASGFMLATVFSAWAAPDLVTFYGGWTVLLVLAALATRTASLLRNARLRPISNMQTAIGVRHPRIVQKSQGAMGGSFNTREFFHGKPERFLRAVKWGFLLLTFPLPILLLLAGLLFDSPPLLLAAFAVQYLGLLAERWYFFAQANHPQNLYYQHIS